MSRKRERRRKRLEQNVAKKKAAYDKLSKGGIVKRTKTKAKTLANKEL